MTKLLCISTLILNITGQPFGEDRRDVKALERTIKVCKTDERYKDSPCLKKILKKEPGVYWAECGSKEEFYND